MSVSSVPQVSVLLPVFNAERTLDETIASVVGQDFSDFELIILDNGSTDESSRILHRWVERDSRIRLFCLPNNCGSARGRDHALAQARGKYIAPQDADDVCLAGRFARQVNLLDREQDVALVTGGRDFIDEEGTWIGREMAVFPPEVKRYLLNFSNAVGGHAQVMYRRDQALAVGGYRAEFECSDDYDLWTRLACCGRIETLPIIGMKNRMHAGRMSVVHAEVQRRRSLMIANRMITELLGRPITNEEEDAIASVWRQEGRTGAGACAHALLTEAFSQFMKVNANPAHRRLVRFATAQRWVRSSAALARRGHKLETVRHLIYSLHWHPWAIVDLSAEKVARSAQILFSRIKINIARHLRR